MKLFNFRLVEITNPSMYVGANNIVSYAKFMDRVAGSTDICAIHGFLRRVWIHRLHKQIHDSMDIADPQIAPNRLMCYRVSIVETETEKKDRDETYTFW